MSYRQAMSALREAGTAQNRKIYARHGVTDEMFGVSYKELGALRKKFGPDTKLALELWESGNHDARVLATQIARPEEMTSARLDRWVRGLSSYVVADAFSKLASDAPSARSKMRAWIRSRDEWRARAGWLMSPISPGARPRSATPSASSFSAESSRASTRARTAPATR